MVWGILVIRSHTCKILYPDSYEGYVRVAFLYSFAFGHSSSLTLKTENWTNKNKWKKKKTENWVASGSWACLSGNLPALDQLFRLPRIPYPPYQLFSLSASLPHLSIKISVFPFYLWKQVLAFLLLNLCILNWFLYSSLSRGKDFYDRYHS